MKKSSILLLFALGCSIPGKTQRFSSPPPFDPGAPSQIITPKTFHVRHYALTLSFDEAAGEVFASESLDFEPVDRPLRALVLDAEGLEIESVDGNAGKQLGFEMLPKSISIDLGVELAPGQHQRVTIRYHAVPKRTLHF